MMHHKPTQLAPMPFKTSKTLCEQLKPHTRSAHSLKQSTIYGEVKQLIVKFRMKAKKDNTKVSLHQSYKLPFQRYKFYLFTFVQIFF
jgi:hypothetical protein